MTQIKKTTQLDINLIYRYFDGELTEHKAVEVFRAIQKDPEAQLVLENLSVTRTALNQHVEELAEGFQFDTLWDGINAGLDQSARQEIGASAASTDHHTIKDRQSSSTADSLSPIQSGKRVGESQSWWPNLRPWRFGLGFASLGFASAAAVLVFSLFFSAPKTAIGHDVRVERFEVADGMVGTIFSVDEKDGGTMKVLWLSSNEPYHGATTDMDTFKNHIQTQIEKAD